MDPSNWYFCDNSFDLACSLKDSRLIPFGTISIFSCFIPLPIKSFLNPLQIAMILSTFLHNLVSSPLVIL